MSLDITYYTGHINTSGCGSHRRVWQSKPVCSWQATSSHKRTAQEAETKWLHHQAEWESGKASREDQAFGLRGNHRQLSQKRHHQLTGDIR